MGYLHRVLLWARCVLKYALVKGLMMEYEMNNGMLVDVDYCVDPHDWKCLEIESVDWRGIKIMHVLSADEMNELFTACYEAELDRARCAAGDRYDAHREEA